MALGSSTRSSREARMARLLRSDAGVIDDTPVEGNLVRLKTPKALSLVGLPANQTGFKVLRSAQPGDQPMSTVIRRTKRSDTGPVLRLAFPSGTTTADAEKSLKDFGMEGYKLEEVDGIVLATRADVKSISPEATSQIKLTEDGLIATVQRIDASPVPEEKAQIALASVEFDGEKFSLEDVQRWAQEKGVDGTIEAPQNSGESYVVRRSDIKDGEDSRRMVLEDGVTAVITRSDVLAVPDGYVAVISEAAYGSWGWGQLDFTAKMADKVFSQQMEDAIYSLRSVLDQIVIYSPLPLDMRKELANRALSQFGEFMSAVMDNLPRQLLVSVARSATPNLEKTMTQPASGTPTPEPKNEPAAAAATASTETLTRADVQQMIKDGFAELAKTLTPAQAAPVQRADGTPAEPAAAAAGAAAAGTQDANLTRADLAAAFGDAMKPVLDRLEKVEGLTVVRSAQEQVPPTTQGEQEQDVFRGAIPGLRVKAAKK